MAMPRSRNAGTQRPVAGDARHPLEGGGRQQRQPQAPVGGEALLGGEVVGVELGGVDPQPAGGRGGVDGHQSRPASAGRSPAGRRISMATPVEVSLWVRA